MIVVEDWGVKITTKRKTLKRPRKKKKKKKNMGINKYRNLKKTLKHQETTNKFGE